MCCENSRLDQVKVVSIIILSLEGSNNSLSRGGGTGGVSTGDQREPGSLINDDFHSPRSSGLLELSSLSDNVGFDEERTLGNAIQSVGGCSTLARKIGTYMALVSPTCSSSMLEKEVTFLPLKTEFPSGPFIPAVGT